MFAMSWHSKRSVLQVAVILLMVAMFSAKTLNKHQVAGKSPQQKIQNRANKDREAIKQAAVKKQIKNRAAFQADRFSKYRYEGLNLRSGQSSNARLIAKPAIANGIRDFRAAKVSNQKQAMERSPEGKSLVATAEEAVKQQVHEKAALEDQKKSVADGAQVQVRSGEKQGNSWSNWLFWSKASSLALMFLALFGVALFVWNHRNATANKSQQQQDTSSSVDSTQQETDF